MQSYLKLTDRLEASSRLAWCVHSRSLAPARKARSGPASSTSSRPTSYCEAAQGVAGAAPKWRDLPTGSLRGRLDHPPRFMRGEGAHGAGLERHVLGRTSAKSLFRVNGTAAVTVEAPAVPLPAPAAAQQGKLATALAAEAAAAASPPAVGSLEGCGGNERSF